MAKAVTRRDLRLKKKSLECPCGTCKTHCGSGQSSVFCETCNLWYHRTCQELTREVLTEMSKNSNAYVCTSCCQQPDDSNFDFKEALGRLSTAADMGFPHLRQAVEMEDIFLRSTKLRSPSLLPAPKPLVVDELSLSHLLPFGQRREDLSRVPVQVAGDGNCLFNSISVALYGDELSADELRLRTCLELVRHGESYRAPGIVVLSPDLEEECLHAAKDGSFSSAWMMAAATTVIGQPIRSVYPTLNGMLDIAVAVLNTTFHPRGSQSSLKTMSPSVVLLWTGGQSGGGKTWTPNHFVPLISESNPRIVHQACSLPRKRKHAEVTGLSLEASPTSPVFSARRRLQMTSAPKQVSSVASSPKVIVVKTTTTSLLLSSPEIDLQSVDADTKPNDVTHQADETPLLMSPPRLDTIHETEDASFRMASPLLSFSSPTEAPVSSPTEALVSSPTEALVSSPTETQVSSPTETQVYSTTEAQVSSPTEAHVSSPTEAQVSSLTEAHVSSPTEAQVSSTTEAPVSTGKNSVKNVCLPMGEGALPTNGHFLETADLIDALRSTDPTPEHIPNGMKENVYFVLDGSAQIERRRSGKKPVYHDDCGLYGKSTSIKTAYFRDDGEGGFMYMEKRGGVFVRGKKRIPIQPQPAESDLYALTRYYASLKRDPCYKRRISWFDKVPSTVVDSHCMCVEYIGQYPKDIPAIHGNSKSSGCENVRTRPEVMEKLTEMSKTQPPRSVCETLTLDDSCEAARDSQQVWNMTKKDRPTTAQDRRNQADDLLQLFSEFPDVASQFVQEVAHTKTKPACIIMYTDEQIQDLSRLLDSSRPFDLGADTTFNHGPFFLTFLCFKNSDLVRRVSQASPIFLGPMYLHWDGSHETYHRFFSHLKCKLGRDIQSSRTRCPVGGMRTNNACQSIKHVLKLACQGKTLRLPELAERLHAIVRLQYQDMRRALHGQGNYELPGYHAKFRVTDMAWRQKTQDEKDEIFQRFLKYRRPSGV